MTRKDIDMHDDDVYENILDSIPDEMVTLTRTKSGIVTLNRRGVYNLAIKGMSANDMAKVFGVSDETINANFKYELTAGRGMIGPRLKHNLLRSAMAEKPNPALLLFALKNYTELTEEGIKGEMSSETPSWTINPPTFNHRKAMSDSERAELDGEDS